MVARLSPCSAVAYRARGRDLGRRHHGVLCRPSASCRTTSRRGRVLKPVRSRSTCSSRWASVQIRSHLPLFTHAFFQGLLSSAPVR